MDSLGEGAQGRKRKLEMSRLERFYEDSAQLIFRLGADPSVPQGSTLDRTSNEFRFSITKSLDQIVSVAVVASEDYPEGTVVCVEGEEPVFLCATVPEIFDKYYSGESSENWDALSVSPLKVDSASGSEFENESDSGDEYASTELDNKLEKDLESVQNKFRATDGTPLTSSLILPGIETCEIHFLLTLDHLKPHVVKAWGLDIEEPLLIKLDQIDTIHYRGSQKRPIVNVILQDDIDMTKSTAVGEQLTMILRNFIREKWNKDEDGKNILEEIFALARSRLASLSEYCMICDEKHQFGGMLLPSVCFKPLCTFAYENLGLMAKVANLARQMEVVDLLILFLHSAAHSDRATGIFKPFPSISHPTESDLLSLDPSDPDFEKVREILNQFPCIASMADGDVSIALKDVHPLAWPLVRWTLSSNRSFLMQLPKSDLLDFMNTNHQFLMLADSPEKEEEFCRAKAQSPKGSVFLFHGSPMENWHSILRKGLIVASGTSLQINAAAHGKGIYLSPSSQVSMQYSFAKSRYNRGCSTCPSVRQEGHSCTQDGRFLSTGSRKQCIAICEVVDTDNLVRTTNNNIWLLKKPEHCCTRFLFALDNNGGMNVDLRTPAVIQALEGIVGNNMSGSDGLLGLIVDLDPVWWGKEVEGDEGSLGFFLKAVGAFCNAYSLSNPLNSLFLTVAGTSSQRTLVYYTGMEDTDSENCGAVVIRKLKEAILSAQSNDTSEGSRLAGPLATALCYMNRKTKSSLKGFSGGRRLLILKVSDDRTFQHLSLMTLFFAAHKQNVILDGCSIGRDSAILQQAADITNGTYQSLQTVQELSQILMTVFFSNPSTRKRLVYPPMKDVDYSPSCFCHHKMVQIGWVCSVCLSVFCHFTPICPTCHSAFKFLPTLGKTKKKSSKTVKSSD